MFSNALGVCLSLDPPGWAYHREGLTTVMIACSLHKAQRCTAYKYLTRLNPKQKYAQTLAIYSHIIAKIQGIHT